ncbi:hypothetical protein HXX76_014156 [Chlamydomonas incerta]|uniref:Glycosyltransferase n=1 Tax=Chlamydomonas incerta TaxID=51695 RepID=A0A835SK71_CHLIN|nr:hypothetical protein HXX76_014156 [Chlamydomonas incerta]|eukprot:KAG2424998.1 hypothetical protein HXX76_014156 [Chlamydomonas incerta]
MTKLYIGTPAYGCYVTKEWLSSMIMLRATCARNQIDTHVKLMGNESLITRARNLIVADFLRSDATHLFFVDADIRFNAQDVVNMVRADKDILCGVYSKKAYNWKRERRNPHEPIQQALLDFNINVVGKAAVLDNRFIEVLDAATGFMMIKRGVVEKMVAHYTELQCVNDVGDTREIPTYTAIFDCMIDPSTRRALSEDYSFVRRWQLMGGKVYVDMDVALGHVGNVSYDPSNLHLVMLCVVMDERGECSLDVAVMCLQLPFARQYAALHVNFVASYDEAMTLFKQDPEYEILVCTPAGTGDCEFVINALDHTQFPMVVGMSVLPVVNWERVVRGEPCSEYNIPRAHLGTIDGDGYAPLLVPFFDMQSRFPTSFVMSKKYTHGTDTAVVDTRRVLKGTRRTEFAGCLKLRFGTPAAAAVAAPAATGS